MTRAAATLAAAALAAVVASAGCTSDGGKPAPSSSPSGSPSPDAFAPRSRADLAARIEAELPKVKAVTPEQTDAYYALSTACLHLSRTEKATTDAVAASIGLAPPVRADLRAAADSCGTDPAGAAATLRRVVAALKA